MSRRPRRTTLMLAGALVAVSTSLLACAPRTEPLSFSPGMWTSRSGDASIRLNEDGTGTALLVPFVYEEDMGFCPDDASFRTYSGALLWTWGNDERFIYLEYIDADRAFADIAPRRDGDWSSVSYWACGDPDLPGTLVLVHVADASPGT